MIIKFMAKNQKPFEIIFLGPPVSGKGTQAQLLSETFDIPHISMGQILHAIKSDANNSLAKEVAGYMDAGALVPDQLVDKLLLARIKESDCLFGFVLDGYPRNMSQAKVINGAADLDYVFLIHVSDSVIIERISGRRVCANGHTWHIKFAPTKVDDVCDLCQKPLFQRDDDQPIVVTDRLKVYHQEMKPIINFYEKKKILIRIDGEKSIEKVFQQVVRHLVYDLRDKINL